MKKCPIEIAFYRTSLGKKWTLTIIRDLIFGRTRFTDFLKTNPSLSSKVLAERLRELENDAIIQKINGSNASTTHEYELTNKGKALNKILYELSMFGSKYYPEEVFGDQNISYKETIDIFGNAFLPLDDEIIFNKLPVVIREKIDSPISI